MERTDLEKIRSTSCENVALRLGFVVKQHRTRCCFHDDHSPSMTFKGSGFRCWACGASGDNIDLVMRYLHIGFREAVEWLAREHNVILTEYKPETTDEPRPFDASRYERFFERPWLNAEARRFLFQERRIDPRVVAWCRLTSWQDRQGVSWLQIPYFDREGRLTGIQNRNLVRGALPRFRFPSGSVCGLYNLPVLNRLRPGDELYICEGCSDTWAMLSAGHKAVAVPSATLLGRKDAELLQSLASSLSLTFHIYPDQDAPGERLYSQLKQLLPNLARHQLPQGYKDFGEFYAASKARDP